jgi:hypothetical protein
MRVALMLALTVLTLWACETPIGSDCSSDAECGTGRICDRSSHGGYCTVSPCDRDSCPADSVCVEFEDESTWCMATCDTDSDCRDEYRCDAESGAAPFCRRRD